MSQARAPSRVRRLAVTARHHSRYRAAWPTKSITGASQTSWEDPDEVDILRPVKEPYGPAMPQARHLARWPEAIAPRAAGQVRVKDRLAVAALRGTLRRATLDEAARPRGVRGWREHVRLVPRGSPGPSRQLCSRTLARGDRLRRLQPADHDETAQFPLCNVIGPVVLHSPKFFW